MKILVDSSCLVSFFLRDTQFAPAQAVLDRIVSGELQASISAISFAEICGAVRRLTDEPMALDVQRKLTRFMAQGFLNVVPVTSEDGLEAGSIATATGLKGADAVIVQATRKTGARLFTFDAEVRKKAGSQVAFLS